MKNKTILLLIVALLIGMPSFSSAAVATRSFKISGTVFYDADGNGIHDVGEDSYVSSGKSCKRSIIVKGTKIKVTAQKGKTVKTSYYFLDKCGLRKSGQYSGIGIYYVTKLFEVGTMLTFEVIPPSGWRSTWPNPITLEVQGENYVDFAIATNAPAPQVEKVNVSNPVAAPSKAVNATAPTQAVALAPANETAQEIETITQAQNTSKEKVAELTNSVEKRSKVKSFFFGSDYENLGNLRSEMVKTESQIKQLERLAEKTENSQEKSNLQTQIQSLEQEQSKMDSFITQNEDQFSLFGWVVKLFS